MITLQVYMKIPSTLTVQTTQHQQLLTWQLWFQKSAYMIHICKLYTSGYKRVCVDNEAWGGGRRGICDPCLEL